MNRDGAQHRKYLKEEKERREQRGADVKKTEMTRREQNRGEENGREAIGK